MAGWWRRGVAELGATRRRGRTVGSVLVAWALASGTGCAGSVVLSDDFAGQCAVRHRECTTERCAGVVDGRDCELICDYEARLCQGGQRGDVSTARRVKADEALLIDLGGTAVASSSAITVSLSPEVTVVNGARRLPPGAHLKASIRLPPHVRTLEMHLVHAPAGDGTNCFLTATVGEGTLLGRYAPPRAQGDALRREVWDLTRFLKQAPEAQTVELFLYNNAAAGSTRPYDLGSVELYYRRLEPRE